MIAPRSRTGRIPVGPWRAVVDPMESVPDAWFVATDFTEVKEPKSVEMSHEREASLSRAKLITRDALSTSAAGNDYCLARGAGMHLHAAELRRQAGAWAECSENYEALALYHQRIGNSTAVEAYVRRVIFVSNYNDCNINRAKAFIFALKMYCEVGNFKKAWSIVGRAFELVKECGDSELSGRVADLAAHVSAARRGGGSKRQSKVGWSSAPKPSEFDLQAVPADPGTLPELGSPGPFATRSGFDLLMQKPGAGGECRYWVTHRVSDGSHDIITLPNWYGRAMGAASAMLKFSDNDRSSTEFPSSVILQVSCALEAFMNSVVHFIRSSRHSRFYYEKLPDYCFPDFDLNKDRSSTIEKFRDISEALFSEDILLKEQIVEVVLLFVIRNQLVHYKGDNEERIVFDDAVTHPMTKRIGERAKRRKKPGPWVDKVLTFELAEWAFQLGETSIEAFRTAWERREAAALANVPPTPNEGCSEDPHDYAEMEPDGNALRRQNAALAEFKRRSGSQLTMPPAPVIGDTVPSSLSPPHLDLLKVQIHEP